MTEPRNRRILVTGSRDWTDRAAINSALREHARPGDTLVHGACPTGADAIAAELWSGWGPLEPHPADWSKGRRAGPDRNRHMVSLGADLCLASIGSCTSPRCARTDVHDSHGASGCARMAEAAGIPVLEVRP